MAAIEGKQLRVLVEFKISGGVSNHPVKSSGSREALVSAIRERFADLLPSPSVDAPDLVTAISDDSWGADVFVDLLDQDTPNRAVLRFRVAQRESSQLGFRAMAYNWSLTVIFCILCHVNICHVYGGRCHMHKNSSCEFML